LVFSLVGGGVACSDNKTRRYAFIKFSKASVAAKLVEDHPTSDFGEENLEIAIADVRISFLNQ